jgi:hypothetical protein
MENNTGIELGDHVRCEGGFETGLTGQVVDIDLSGEVKKYPRFTIHTDGATPEQRKRMGGFHAINLEKLGPDEWTEDTGHWSDGAKSWVAHMDTPETKHPIDQTPAVPSVTCTLRVRDNSTAKEPSSDFFWAVLRTEDRSYVDQGMAPTLEWAQRHAIRAVVWHGHPKGD